MSVLRKLGVLVGQCLDRRIPDLATLESEVAAWELARNAEQVRINWQFITTNARFNCQKLGFLAPALRRLV